MEPIVLAKNGEVDGTVQCAISGENSRTHNKIKGFNAMGSVLIGYKENAYCSYGNKQGDNGNIALRQVGYIKIDVCGLIVL